MLTLIKDTRIVDANGSAEEIQDVLIDADRVAAIGQRGNFDNVNTKTTVSADGQVLAPGFIDVHAHSDHTPLRSDDDTSKILQGVTTEVNGNCGFSFAPISPLFRDEFVALVSRIFPPGEYLWSGFSEFTDVLQSSEFVTNYVTLLGHNTLRIAAMGVDARKPTAQEMTSMKHLLSDAIEAGVAGLSTGLVYPPGVFSEPQEVTELLRLLPSTAVYASHMRNESTHLLESLQETTEAAAAGDVHCHISHLKSADGQQSGRMERALNYLNNVRSHGYRVTQDIYPYTALSTMLSALLPPWMHDGGSEALKAKLKSPELVSKAKFQIESNDVTFENYGRQAGWDKVIIASTRSGKHVGRSIANIAANQDSHPVDVVAKLLLEEDLSATMVVHAMQENDVELALADPFTMIGTDGLPAGTGGQPHPRGYGSFPRVLDFYTKNHAITFREAIRRMTALPASIFGLRERGMVKEGWFADLVLLNPDDLTDTATYANPTLPPLGITHVIVNGEIVVKNGQWQHRRTGRFLPVKH